MHRLYLPQLEFSGDTACSGIATTMSGSIRPKWVGNFFFVELGTHCAFARHHRQPKMDFCPELPVLRPYPQESTSSRRRTVAVGLARNETNFYPQSRFVLAPIAL
jgi:hypothetical protein